MAGSAHGPGLPELLALGNVAIIAAIFYFGGRKGILAGIKSRSEGVAKKLRESKEELARVQAALSQAQKDLAEFETNKAKALASVRAEGEAFAKNLIDEAKMLADRIVSDSRLAAQNELALAASELRKRLVVEALAEAQKAIASNEDQKTSIHKQLFDNFTQDLALKGGSANGR